MPKIVRFNRPQKKPRQTKRRRPMPFWLPLGLMLGFAAGAWLMIEMGEPVQQPRKSATVQESFPICGQIWPSNCVIDGDTIRYHGVSIRLEDINAPESHKASCAAEKALGDRATRRLTQLINEGAFEMVNRGGRDKDQYGRKLRTLERNGRSLGGILVAEGLARRWVGYRRSWCG